MSATYLRPCAPGRSILTNCEVLWIISLLVLVANAMSNLMTARFSKMVKMASKGQFSSWPKEAGHMLIGERARARMDTCLLGITLVVLNEIVGASQWCSCPT